MEKYISNSIDNPFVIQKHRTPDGVHWDLMLQIENALWTWRICQLPEHSPGTSISAEKIADHPLRFLSYEGPVQNDTASVKIADRGKFKITKQTDMEIDFEAEGKTLLGTFQLRLEQGDIWSLVRIR